MAYYIAVTQTIAEVWKSKSPPRIRKTKIPVKGRVLSWRNSTNGFYGQRRWRNEPILLEKETIHCDGTLICAFVRTSELSAEVLSLVSRQSPPYVRRISDRDLKLFQLFAS